MTNSVGIQGSILGLSYLLRDSNNWATALLKLAYNCSWANPFPHSCNFRWCTQQKNHKINECLIYICYLEIEMKLLRSLQEGLLKNWYMANRNVKSGYQVESSNFLIEFTHLASSFSSLGWSSCWVVLAGSVEFSGFEGSGAFAASVSRKNVLPFKNEF